MRWCGANCRSTLPAVHLDMLWHERDARSPAHKWLRKHLEDMNATSIKSGMESD